MRTICRFALAALMATAGRLPAQINTLAVTTPPGSLTISDAAPGGSPLAQRDVAARYSVNVSGGRKKVTGQLDAPLPAGVTLTIQLAAPSGATGLGSIALTDTPRDLVRFISAGQSTGLQVTLVLSASVAAGVIAYTTSHVVLTLADDP